MSLLEPTLLQQAEGNTEVLECEDAQGPGTEVHRGPRAGHVHEGSPGTWEALLLPRWPAAVGAGVPPDEETKCGEDERQGVGVPQ
jgi:hypothetical protein